MKNKIILCLSMLFSGSLFCMELVGPDTYTFKNGKNEQITVAKATADLCKPLRDAAQKHTLCNSIGTHGWIYLDAAEVQNFKLMQTCFEYNSLNSEQLNQTLSRFDQVTHIPHLIQVMQMCSVLNMPIISKTIAKNIGTQLQIPKKRCQAFKEGIFARITAKPEVLNLVSQEIITRNVKDYLVTETKKTTANVADLHDQLNTYLTPERALILLDSYQNRVEGKPLSFTPGQEEVLPKVLSDLVKPTLAQKLSFNWNRLQPAKKWTISGLGAATLMATGYGFYTWWNAQ
ncbi:hypothetical protein BH09DEP1_BH09DEP1_0940 [soil metagenome]